MNQNYSRAMIPGPEFYDLGEVKTREQLIQKMRQFQNSLPFKYGITGEAYYKGKHFSAYLTQKGSVEDVPQYDDPE